MSTRRVRVKNGNYEIATTIHGAGPVLLCIHGWPEHAHSWRHQVREFTARGYCVVTIDVRGYGDSAKPEAIEAYTLEALASDVAAVARFVSDAPVILFGHDWGAPIVYATALRHPDCVTAVAGLSVPYAPASELSTIDLLRQIYADRFFYILYFQQPGLVEQEVEPDLRTALRKIYHSLSGDAPDLDWLKEKPADAGLLDDLVLPADPPEWLPEADFQHYLAAFEKSGFHGPIARYRAMPLDVELDRPLLGVKIHQPACFIGGAKDAIRNYVPGMDGYADVGGGFEDFRGATIIPGAGHWVQQEAPAATNQALAEFLASLS
ncbi:MAG: alpha/beta hydrolase [Pseudomonadota bacterium]